MRPPGGSSAEVTMTENGACSVLVIEAEFLFGEEALRV